MASIISPKWMARMECVIRDRTEIDEIITYQPAAAWLIARLSRVGIPYKIYNLGAGAKRITTNTDTCPCCKHKLEE